LADAPFLDIETEVNNLSSRQDMFANFEDVALAMVHENELLHENPTVRGMRYQYFGKTVDAQVSGSMQSQRDKNIVSSAESTCSIAAIYSVCVTDGLEVRQ
jgi:hypothetical protein